MKGYKRQIEEAEEIAALNLAKYRQVTVILYNIPRNTRVILNTLQVQTNLTGSNERADLNEQALAKSRARARSCSIGPM